MNERNLNEGQWEDKKQWSLGVGQRKKAFLNRYIQGETQKFEDKCYKAQITSYMDIIYFYSAK